MKYERILWASFTALALLCQYFLLTDRQQNQPSMVSAASPEEVIPDEEQIPPDLMQEFPLFAKGEEIDVEYLFTEPEQNVEQSKDSSFVNSNDPPMDDYSRGYTDGYHRATEQMNCPYPTR